MPIEFRCPQCQKLLRVGDDAAGKQAKCPACATLVAVPTLGPPPADEFTIEPPSPPPPPPTGSPFGTAGTNPFASAPMPQRLAPASDNPYAAPLTGGEPVPGFVNPSTINVNGVFNVMWPVFKANMGMLIAVFFVEMIIVQAVNFGSMIPLLAVQAGAPDPVMIIGVSVFRAILLMIVSVWLNNGRDLFYIQTAKGLNPNFSVMFAGHPYLLKRILLSLIWTAALLLIVMLPGLIVGVITNAITGDDDAAMAAGFIVGTFLMIPMTWLGLVYFPAWFLVIDQPLGIFESLRVAKTISYGNRLSLFALSILFMLLAMAGYIACCIGILFTVPMVCMGAVVAYLQMTGQPIRGYDTSVPSHMTV
jgi:hypothetical protein